MEDVQTIIIGGIVVGAFTGLLGYLFGRRGFHQLERDLAVVAPTLAAIKVGIDSVAIGLKGHIESPGHPGGRAELSTLDAELRALRRDVSRLEHDLGNHENNTYLHSARERRE